MLNTAPIYVTSLLPALPQGHDAHLLDSYDLLQSMHDSGGYLRHRNIN